MFLVVIIANFNINLAIWGKNTQLGVQMVEQQMGLFSPEIHRNLQFNTKYNRQKKLPRVYCSGNVITVLGL